MNNNPSHQAQLHADLNRYAALDNLFDAIVDGGFVDGDSDDLRGDPQRLARHLVDTILDDPDYLVTLPKVAELAEAFVEASGQWGDDYLWTKFGLDKEANTWRKALGR